MKTFVKHFMDKFRTHDKKQSAALSGDNIKNLEELRRYSQGLYDFVCNSFNDIRRMTADAGLDCLTDNNDNLIPEIEKYPELKKLYLERKNKKQELEKILHTHPELWRPIEDDVCMYYDFDDIRQKITTVTDEYFPYLQELTQKLTPLTNKFGPLDPNVLLKGEDTDLEVAPDETTTNLMNEYFYLSYLYLDTLATMGDEQDKILWEAVPQIIKDNYVRFVNDKMVQILASDDRLVEYVKKFDVNRANNDAHECFIRLLEKKLNAKIFGEAGRPVCFELCSDKNKIYEFGAYNASTGKVVLNTACWETPFCPGVDDVIATIKHEVFGHYANDNLSSLGLYGELMKDFMREIQKCTHSYLIPAMNIKVLEVVSPLLKQNYLIDMRSKFDLQNLQKHGWGANLSLLKDDYNLYQNTFEERSAWLVTPTHDIIRQIDRYRASYRGSLIEKSK